MAGPDNEIASWHLASLALSLVSSDGQLLGRAEHWTQTLALLGAVAPLGVVHDIAAVLFHSGPATRILDKPIRPLPLAQDQTECLAKYRRLLTDIAEHPLATKLSSWRVRDDVIAAVLFRLLTDSSANFLASRRELSDLRGVFLSVGKPNVAPQIWRTMSQLSLRGVMAQASPNAWIYLRSLVAGHLTLLCGLETVDLDTVRLLGVAVGPSQSIHLAGQTEDTADLLLAMNSPQAWDVSGFSMEILPGLLETKRGNAVQRMRMDGYASLERRGNPDSLVLSELAYDADVFSQRVADNELLYYGHERAKEEEKRLTYILVDASASMRGARQVFARGLALALMKRLSLVGEDVWFRFFDAELHECIKVSSKSGILPVSYVVSFRSQSGRNYTRAFRQLFVELSRQSREHGRQIDVYFITHGRCYISSELVRSLTTVAQLHGIFVLPTAPIDADYLPLLRSVEVVEDPSRDRKKQAKEALGIVGRAAAVSSARKRTKAS